MLADTRTNAGVDNISTFRKLTVLEHPGERVVGIMTAGNLALSQAVVNMALEEGVSLHEGEPKETLHTVPSMVRAAQLMGQAVREIYRVDGPSLEAQAGDFNVSILLGGQIGNGRLRLFQIYAAGNYIEATEDTPYLQIGEHKYGKPIIDRAATFDTDVGDALKLALISMDSTMRSNLSVGMPVDLLVYRKDALAVGLSRRIKDDDVYFRGLRQSWSDALTRAYQAIPGPDWTF
jgi:putative proteasome-type protease